MKKWILKFVLGVTFMISITTNIFASNNALSSITIKGIDTPYLNEPLDTTAEISFGKCTIDEVVWYKDNMKIIEDVFNVAGEYKCRVYVTPNPGYKIDFSTNMYISGSSKAIVGEDIKGFYCEGTFKVTERKIDYPEVIHFSGMSKPAYSKKLDKSIVSSNPTYYNSTNVEWYYNGELLPDSYRVRYEGEYTCRVYIELYNGFELNSKLYASIGSKKAEKIIRELKGIFFEITYLVGEEEKPNEVVSLYVNIKEIPAYGRAVKDVVVTKSDKSKYYEISKVEWYRNSFRMLDDYFYDGSYKCRIYINFTNGGYPAKEMLGYVNGSTKAKKIALMNNQYYIEQTYNIDKYQISTLKFDELNIPEYGAVPDTSIDSLEPGIYSPSMVYWYDENGKYLSNMDTFKEGSYKCKFSLNLNVECKMKDTIKALINDEKAKVYFENDKLTVEKTYEIVKPETMWGNASKWAILELEDAINYALIPVSLNGKDLTKGITRAEFAAVSVRLYERLALKSASASQNPFTDTKDSEVFTAYALGLTNGTSETTFEPNSLITRQEMATMMVRALRKAGVSVSVNLNKVKKFADHSKIDSWAQNGVYFMSSVGIIKGKGNNTFDVLGTATREEAIAIAIRSVNMYKY